MKYLSTGEGVEVIEKLKSGWLVQIQAVAYDEEGREELVDGPLRIVDQVLDAAPTAKIDEEIQRKKKYLVDLTENIAAAQKAKREADQEFTALKDRLKQHEALKHIDDYLSGKLTHFVVIPQYSNAYITDGKVRKDEHQWNSSNLRLLSLLGDSKGDLRWNLSEYASSFGSGTDTVYPCMSEAEALEKLQAWIVSDADNDYQIEHRVAAAKRYKLLARPDHVEKLERNAEAARQYRLAEAKKKLAEAEADMVAAKGDPA